MVEVVPPPSTPFLSYSIENNFSILNSSKQIQSRLNLIDPDLPTRVPLCVRGRIHRIEKNNSFSFTFGFKYGKFERLIKEFNEDYHINPLEVVNPEPGTFAAVYLEEDDVFIRVKILRVEKNQHLGISKATVLAIDYGYELEVEKNIFHLVDKFRLDDYRYAFCVPCCLPDFPNQKLFPNLDECREGSDVDVFILSAYEPCLAIFNPTGKTATDSINECIIYHDLDDETSLNLRSFMAQPHLERPMFVRNMKYSNFTAFNWKLVTIIDASKPEAALVRDFFMAIRVIFIQNRLNKLLKDKEFLEPLILKPESATVGLPQYYRGKITALVPEAGWKVKCVDFSCRDLVYNKCPIKEDGTIENLYIMPEVLLNIPYQHYTVSLVETPEPEKNELGGLLYSELVNKVLPPGSVSRILPVPGSMKVKIHDDKHRQIFEDIPKLIYQGSDRYVDAPNPYFREFFNIVKRNNFEDNSDFSVSSAPLNL